MLSSVDILDVHNTNGVVKVIIFAQGEAGKIALTGDADTFIDFGVGIECNDTCSGLHYFTSDPVAEIQRIHNDFSAEWRAFGLLLV